jgi:hypothetical protein
MTHLKTLRRGVAKTPRMKSFATLRLGAFALVPFLAAVFHMLDRRIASEYPLLHGRTEETDFSIDGVPRRETRLTSPPQQE